MLQIHNKKQKWSAGKITNHLKRYHDSVTLQNFVIIFHFPTGIFPFSSFISSKNSDIIYLELYVLVIPGLKNGLETVSPSQFPDAGNLL